MSETATLRFCATGSLADGATTDELAEYVRAAAPFLVPGVLGWGNVVAQLRDSGEVRLWATLSVQTTPLPESAGYGDQVPDAEFVAAYVRGAGEHWLYGHGETTEPLFVPRVVVVRNHA